MPYNVHQDTWYTCRMDKRSLSAFGSFAHVAVVVSPLVLVGVFLRFGTDWYVRRLTQKQVSTQATIDALSDAVFFSLLVAGVACAILVYVRATLRQRTRVMAEEVTQDIAFSREQFKQFYEMSPVPYLLVTPLGIIDRPNKAALRFFATTPQVLIGSSFTTRIVEREERPFVNILMERLRRRVPVERMEIQLTSDDGVVHWALMSIGFLRTDYSKHHTGLVTLVDITEQKELDRMKTEFTSLASHQLRSPLSTIRWYIDFLRARHADELSPVVSEYLGYMHERNQQMIDIVNTLLNLSRIEMGRIKVDKTESDVALIVQDVFREITRTAELSGVTLEVRMEGDTRLTTDAALVRIVLQNLVSNGVRYSKEGGVVTITGLRGPKTFTFVVADTGVGIPLGEQSKIFGKLYRATNAKQLRTDGNGLGLYMSKALTEALGGSITFSSTEGRGTTFTVVLPLW